MSYRVCRISEFYATRGLVGSLASSRCSLNRYINFGRFRGVAMDRSLAPARWLRGCPHVRRTLGEPLGNTLSRGSRQSLDATRNHVWRCGFQWDSVAKEIYRLAICRRFMHIPFVFRVRVESLTIPGKSKRIRKQGNQLEQIAC